MPSAASFVLLTPLPNWRAAEQSIATGIAIRRLLPPERLALESSDALLRHHEIGAPERDGSWLCYDFENGHPSDNVRYRRRQEAAFKLMLHAMYAVQILAPIGAPNLFLLYRKADSDFTLASNHHRQPFIATVWGALGEIPASFAHEIPVVLERVREAFQKPILRLQIPVWLLEQGLAAPDRHIRILLWATGLDGVTRSGGVVAFADRLCHLLGADSAIFPPDARNRHPEYRVLDVVKDLYELRTQMAHGLPFHEKFRKKRAFLAEEFAGWRYDQVLEECAVFLLCKALREVFLRGSPHQADSDDALRIGGRE